MGLPDGDDLIGPVVAGDALNPHAGFARWQRGGDGRWLPAEFVPVRKNMAEPTMVREPDGALLMLCRPWFPNCTGQEANCLQIHRSRDGGKTWSVCLEQEGFWQGGPITLHQAGDGTVFVLTNRFREPLPNKFAKREMLWMWELSEDRSRLREPLIFRDPAAEFGPPPSGTKWRVDHPISNTLRLADGRWHHIVCMRILDDAEMRTEAGATDFTGTYMEEIFSPTPPPPRWNF